MAVTTDSHTLQASDEHSLPSRIETGKPFGLPNDIASEVYFHLLEQPHEKQRKSYKNENRHLLPNPLIVAPKAEHINRIEGGICTVKLVYENGEELPERLREREVLGGQTVCPLDLEHKASFTLKVLETSDRKFRLLFLVQCSVEGRSHLEYILSHPFLVSTNKKRPSIEPPLVFDVKPREIKFNRETEIWIKGRNFCERELTQVTVGGKAARITETEDNLITCVVPAVEPSPSDLPVEVLVSTFHPNKGKLVAENRPIITFKLKLERRVKKPQLEPQSVRVSVPPPVSPKMANRPYGFVPSGFQMQAFPPSPVVMTQPQGQLPMPSNLNYLNMQPYPILSPAGNASGTSAQLVGKCLPTPQPTSQTPLVNRGFIPQSNLLFQTQTDNRSFGSNEAANRFIRQMNAIQGRVINAPVNMQLPQNTTGRLSMNRNVVNQPTERIANEQFQNTEMLTSERRPSNDIFSGLDSQRLTNKDNESIERRQSLSDILTNDFIIENFDNNMLNNVQKRSEI